MGLRKIIPLTGHYVISWSATIQPLFRFTTLFQTPLSDFPWGIRPIPKVGERERCGKYRAVIYLFLWMWQLPDGCLGRGTLVSRRQVGARKNLMLDDQRTCKNRFCPSSASFFLHFLCSSSNVDTLFLFLLLTLQTL